MPNPTSESQRRWFFSAEKRGEVSRGAAKRKSRSVKGKSLPEYSHTREAIRRVRGK